MNGRLSQACISLLFGRRTSREPCFSGRTAERPFILDTQLPRRMPRVRCCGVVHQFGTYLTHRHSAQA